MNQQVSLPNLGGLLSLDMNMLPQTAAGGQLATSDLMSGFGALLNQLVAAGDAPPGLADGQLLPQSGLTLPSGALPQPEMLQQQLEQLAAMLQQQGTEGADRLAELAAKIAEALGQAGAEGQIPAHALTGEMPEAAITKLTEQESSSAQTLPVSDNENTAQQQPDSQAGEAATEQVAVEAQAPTPEELVTPVVTDETDTESDQVEEKLEGAAEGADTATQGDETPVVNQQQTEGAEENEADPALLAATAAMPGTNASTEEASEQSDDAAEDAGHLPDRSRSRAAEHASEQAVFALNERANERAAQRSAVLAAGNVAATETPAVKPEVGAGRSDGQRSAVEQGQAARVVDLTGSTSPDTQSKPESKPVTAAAEPPVDFGKKLEMTLKDAQALLRSVAGQKAAAEVSSSASGRTETVASLTAETYSLQSVQQPSASQKLQTEGQTLMMPNQARMNSPAWHTALGERAIMVATQGARTAQIRLDPPELGALHIRVHLNQDQVSLNFSSPHAQVRDAVEQSLPRLREMFAEQGLALQDSSVSDQSQGERQSTENQQLAEQRAFGRGMMDDGVEMPDGQPQQAARPVNLVDYYA